MYRVKRLSILLGVLAIVCIATVWVLHLEERREQIENSGEVILEIDANSVQELSWIYEGETLSFHRDEGWIYDGDEAFPVDEEKIQALLEQFQAFSAAFIITDVEDYGQYGLDDPVCTIDLTAAEQSYEILLGDYSTMDAQRYVSIGDGNVYLAVSDPLDSFNTGLSDLIDHDETPAFDQVNELVFTGAEHYSIFRQEDSSGSYSAEDIYFTQQDGQNLPLDTSRVDGYLDVIRYLGLTDYVTYHVTDEELEQYGLDDPELTVTVDYADENEDGDMVSTTFSLSVSRDPQERNTASETSAEETDEEETVTAYVRVGQSQIVYQISSEEYRSLMAASYNDLRHQEVLWADFSDISQIDISLEGVDYTITSEEDGDTRTYCYQEEEIDLTDLQNAVEALTAEQFTSETPTEQEEIRMTIHLDSESFPEVDIQLYRYDGTYCLAVVDGEPVSLVQRSAVVNLMEAVRVIVLN